MIKNDKRETLLPFALPDLDDAEWGEIREALENYGAVVNKVTIEAPEKEGRYLAIVDVDTDETGVKVLTEQINGRVWKGQKLRANAYLFLK